jgi:hypothetical protein
MRFACLVAALAAVGPIMAFDEPAFADPLPKQVGQCSETAIRKIETRLVDGTTGKPVPGSGSAVSFANRGYQVSYDAEPAIQASRRGDRVRICLVKLPEACPPGDNRGRVYTTTNLRTNQSWTLPDSEHSCGGA